MSYCHLATHRRLMGKKQIELILLVTIPDPLDHICVNRLCVKSLTEDTNRLEVLSIKMSESSAGSTSSQKSLGSPLDPDGQKHLNRPFSFLTSKHKFDFCILKVESDQQEVFQHCAESLCSFEFKSDVRNVK